MNISQQNPNVSPDDAAAALAENRRRESQTVTAGTSPWPASGVLPVVLALPVLGYLIDIDLTWLFAVLVGTMAAFSVKRSVQLRADRRSVRWDLALLGTMVLALAADIAVQFFVRNADLPLPNTWGMAAISIVVLTLTWPVQRRGAARVAA